MTAKTQDERKTIAQTIISQLGGKRFITMTGASRMMITDKGLEFRLPGTMTAGGINCVQIDLNAMDTYGVRFLKVRSYGITSGRRPTITTVSEVEGICCDMLAECFEDATGLFTRL